MRHYTNLRARLLLPLAAAFSLATACGPYRQKEAGGDVGAARLFFTNESIDQAAVYAIAGGQDVRIGTVMAGRTETLVVPTSIAASGTAIRIIARPLGKSTIASSGPITIVPGQAWSIRLPFDQNTLVVLPP